MTTMAQRPSSWRTAERLPPSWRRRVQFQDRNDAIKLDRGCADCGWAEWARGLDWDHVRGRKTAVISTMIANGRAWTEIEEEMLDIIGWGFIQWVRLRELQKATEGMLSELVDRE